MEKSRNKIEMKKLKNPLKMNEITVGVGVETLSHFYLFEDFKEALPEFQKNWQNQDSIKENFQEIAFVSHPIKLMIFHLVGGKVMNNFALCHCVKSFAVICLI